MDDLEKAIRKMKRVLDSLKAVIDNPETGEITREEGRKLYNEYCKKLEEIEGDQSCTG